MILETVRRWTFELAKEEGSGFANFVKFAGLVLCPQVLEFRCFV